MQVADQLGVGLGELPERAVQEVDAGACRRGAVGDSSAGSKPSLVELGLERAEAAARLGCAGRRRLPQTRPVVGGVGGVGADALGQRGEQPGEQRVRGRVEAEPGRAGGEEVEVLGPADGAAVDGLDVDEAGLAEALEVEAHGVGVQPEARRRGPGPTAAAVERASSSVHGVAGLVAEGLEHRELVRLRGTA